VQPGQNANTCRTHLNVSNASHLVGGRWAFSGGVSAPCGSGASRSLHSGSGPPVPPFRCAPPASVGAGFRLASQQPPHKAGSQTSSGEQRHSDRSPDPGSGVSRDEQRHRNHEPTDRDRPPVGRQPGAVYVDVKTFGKQAMACANHLGKGARSPSTAGSSSTSASPPLTTASAPVAT